MPVSCLSADMCRYVFFHKHYREFSLWILQKPGNPTPSGTIVFKKKSFFSLDKTYPVGYSLVSGDGLERKERREACG